MYSKFYNYIIMLFLQLNYSQYYNFYTYIFLFFFILYYLSYYSILYLYKCKNSSFSSIN